LTYADHEVSAAFGDITLTDDVKAYSANAVTIFGSGPANYADLLGDYDRDLYFAETGRVAYSGKHQSESPFSKIPENFVKPSRLAFSTNEGMPTLIDLGR
jgi:hypothetical protein